MSSGPHHAGSRRSFLRGGVVAAGGVAAATALSVSPVGAAVGPPVYQPSGPVRMYDSRVSGGKLYPLEERDVHTGAGPEILALTFNLTVTETEGPGGFLAMFPGDIDWPGSSSVNWFGPDQNLANNAFVRIPANGIVTVRCGGQGGTHFVLDVIGESVTPAAVSDVRVKDNIAPVRW
jgi:hypothetical protein